MAPEHQIELVPQSIVDGWQVKCSCGWQSFASFYEFQTKDVLLAELQKRFDAHADLD